MTEADRAEDPRLAGVRAILKVMDRLREPGGCDWDRAQSSLSLRPYLVEETYEVLEALDREEPELLCDELGDLLFQIVFHSRIHEESGAFDFGDVGQAIADKLTRRHPHVFGDEDQRAGRAPRKSWEQFKREELAARGAARSSKLDGVPAAMPALARSQKLQDKAAKTGFDWPDLSGPLDKLREEMGELEAELDGGDPAALADELGDVLFSVVALARHLKLDAESALRAANGKFQRRFRAMEAADPQLAGGELDGLEALWQAVKKDEGRGP